MSNSFHRKPVPNADELVFKADHRLRNSLAVTIGLATVAALIYLNIGGISSLDLHSPLGVILLFADILGPFVISGCLYTLRGKELLLDRRNGKVLVASSYGARIGEWRPEGRFDPQGEMRFEYCKAELQSLCMVSHRPDPQSDWILLLIYTTWDQAHAAADILRQWEPRLQIDEFQDPTTLPESRGLKPLVH